MKWTSAIWTASRRSNFTIQHDDGQSLDTIREAEVILVGASRTSKTPTCVYLAIRGVRAANIPLVPGMAAAAVLLTASSGPLIVGLWVSPDRLVQVRRNRLTSMGEERDTNYIDLDAVRAEIAATRQLFDQQDWPQIDVSRRSIEETAASVMNLLTERRERSAMSRLVAGLGQPARQTLLRAAGVAFIVSPASLNEAALMQDLIAKGSRCRRDRRGAGGTKSPDGSRRKPRRDRAGRGFGAGAGERNHQQEP